MERHAVAIAAILLVSCTERERAPSSRDGAAPAMSAAAPATSSTSATEVPSEPLAPPPRAPRVATVETATMATSAVADWVWKTYRGDHFSILFPGDPKVTVLPPEDDKAGYTEALLDVPGGQVSFAAGFTEHSQEEVSKPETFLDDRVNAPRRGLTDVLHKRSMTLPGGQPGRVLILRRNISGTPLRVYSRLYLVGRRLYSLIVSTLDAGGVSEEVVKRFMESFKLL